MENRMTSRHVCQCGNMRCGNVACTGAVHAQQLLCGCPFLLHCNFRKNFRSGPVYHACHVVAKRLEFKLLLQTLSWVAFCSETNQTNMCNVLPPRFAMKSAPLNCGQSTHSLLDSATLCVKNLGHSLRELQAQLLHFETLVDVSCASFQTLGVFFLGKG